MARTVEEMRKKLRSGQTRQVGSTQTGGNFIGGGNDSYKDTTAIKRSQDRFRKSTSSKRLPKPKSSSSRKSPTISNNLAKMKKTADVRNLSVSEQLAANTQQYGPLDRDKFDPLKSGTLLLGRPTKGGGSPVSGARASGTLDGDTSNTAFGKGLTDTPDYSLDQQGIDNQAGFDKSVDPTADTSPTINVLDGLGKEGFDKFFGEVVNLGEMGDKNIDPLLLNQLKKEYKPLFEAAVGDANKLNQLSTSLTTALAETVEHQKVLNTLDYDKNSILSQFSNGEEVAGKIDQLKKLIEQGETDPDILANKMGMSTDDILRAQQGDFSGFGADLTGPVKDDLSEDIDLAMTRMEEDEKTAREQLDRQLSEQMQDEIEAVKRAERQAEITDHNLSKLAGLTGIGYSSAGILGLAEANQKSKDFISDIRKNYGRAEDRTRDALEKLATDYARNNEDYRKTLNDRMEGATNSFFTTVQAIKDRYGEVNTSAIVALGKAATDYQKTIHNQWKDFAASSRADIATFNSMKDQIIQEEQFLREQQVMDVQDFVNESGNSTYGDIVAGVESGKYTPEMGRKLMAAMQNSLVLSLDEAADQSGIGRVFAQQISEMLNKNMTPDQIMNEIVTGEEFKKYAPVQSLGGTKFRMFGGDIVDPSSTSSSTNVSVNSTGDRNVDGITVGGVEYKVGDKAPGVLGQIGRGEITNFAGGDVGGIVDIGASTPGVSGDPIYAVKSGTVHDFGTDPDGNNFVEIKSGGKVYRYNHLEEVPNLEKDQFLSMGDEFAKMGSSGNSTAPHLDLAIYGMTGDVRNTNQMELEAQARHLFAVKDLSLESVNNMPDEEVDMDFLLDNYDQMDLNRMNDLSLLNGNQRINTFEDNPGREEDYAVYSAINKKIDANTSLPLAYRMSIWHEIPNRQKDNVQERNDINEQIQKMYDMGISIEEAPLLYSAYDVKNPEDRDFGMELINIHKINSDEGINQQKVKQLSVFMNNGEYDNSVMLIEKDLAEEMDASAVRSNAPTEAKTMALVSKMQRTIDVLNEIGATDAGFIGGSIQNGLKKLKTPEATYLKALLTDGNMEKMVEYIGADMTASEVSAVMPIMPQNNDTIANLIAKIQQIQDNSMEKHNSVRRSFFLPLLTPDQLVAGADGKTEAYINHMKATEGELGQGDMYRITQSLMNERQTDEYTDEDFKGTAWE